MAEKRPTTLSCDFTDAELELISAALENSATPKGKKLWWKIQLLLDEGN